MARGLPLFDGGVPERREISIRTAFRGPGARDGFEMATRAVSEGRYTVDPNLERTDRGATLARYVFVLGYRGQEIRLEVREDLVRDEFIELARKPNLTVDEQARLLWLKQDMADRLLALPAEHVYDVG